jgi:ABC-2 type transport system permease protein
MDKNKILIIIQREYLTRIRKKSFLIMSLLGPFLFAAMIILPVWFTTLEDKEIKVIAVADSSHSFIGKIPETQTFKFTYLESANIKDLRKNFQDKGYWGILYISHIIAVAPNAVELISYSQPNLSMKMHIENALNKELEHQKLMAHNIPKIDEILQSVKTNVSLHTIKLEEGGKSKESFTELAMVVGYVGGFLIYLFIFLFGTQVMRGVLEEKTNRIVEVIVSSVKPFELMLGKIFGIAGVGLTQFIIWIVLTLGIVGVAQQSLAPQLSKSPTEKIISQDIMHRQKASPQQVQATVMDDNAAKMEDIFKAIKTINFGVIIGMFIFYFLGGYLLYASLFAAIGSAADNDTDTQQFMLPVTIPLILAIYVMISTINNPESQLSFWFSIIPLTSPVVMMVRIPFGVPYWEVILSASLLIATFIGTTWMAGKIYRTGILMYGKKVTYRELWKWINYKS